MALTREAQQERAAVIRFLQAQLIPRPFGDAGEHWNSCLFETIADIKAGKHVKAVRSNG